MASLTAQRVQMILLFALILSSPFIQALDLEANTLRSVANKTQELAQTSTEQSIDDGQLTNRDSERPEMQYTCKKGTASRRIQVHYFDVYNSIPCEVNYFRDNGVLEEAETLWYAEFDVGFCERSATSLKERLQAWGWQCND